MITLWDLQAHVEILPLWHKSTNTACTHTIHTHAHTHNTHTLHAHAHTHYTNMHTHTHTLLWVPVIQKLTTCYTSYYMRMNAITVVSFEYVWI